MKPLESAVLDSRPRGLARAVGRPSFWIVAVVLLCLAPIAGAIGRGDAPKPPPVLLQLADFELVDQRGIPFGSTQLRGKVWIANFVFTSCPSVCPRLMEKMQRVQHRSKNAGSYVHLVTFTVDPENDTPERMAEFGRRFKASPYRWTLATGSLDAIEKTVIDG